MSRFPRCPTCGQPLPVQRLGVHMTPLQGKIFDAIEASGNDGIEIADLFERILGPRNVASRKTLHVHIYALNQRLGRAGYQIRARRDRRISPGHHEPRPASYWLVKEERNNPRDAISPRQQKALGL